MTLYEYIQMTKQTLGGIHHNLRYRGGRVKWAEGTEGVDGDRDTLIGAGRLTVRDCTQSTEH